MSATKAGAVQQRRAMLAFADLEGAPMARMIPTAPDDFHGSLGERRVFRAPISSSKHKGSTAPTRSR